MMCPGPTAFEIQQQLGHCHIANAARNISEPLIFSGARIGVTERARRFVGAAYVCKGVFTLDTNQLPSCFWPNGTETLEL